MFLLFCIEYRSIDIVIRGSRLKLCCPLETEKKLRELKKSQSLAVTILMIRLIISQSAYSY